MQPSLVSPRPADKDHSDRPDPKRHRAADGESSGQAHSARSTSRGRSPAVSGGSAPNIPLPNPPNLPSPAPPRPATSAEALEHKQRSAGPVLHRPPAVSSSSSSSSSASSSSSSSSASSSSAAPVDDRPLFTCRIPSAAVLTSLLSTLHVERDVYVQIAVMTVGLRFSVERGKNLCARLYFKLPSFSSYTMKDTSRITFSVHLSRLLQCLQVFGEGLGAEERMGGGGRGGGGGGGQGSAVSLELSYHSPGSPLHLVLIDEYAAVTECDIRTKDIDEEEIGKTLNFKEAPPVMRAVVKSNYLRDFFADFESLTGADCITIKAIPDPAAVAAAAAAAAAGGQGEGKTDSIGSTSSARAGKPSNAAGAGDEEEVDSTEPLVSAFAQGDHCFLRADLPKYVSGPSKMQLFTSYDCASPMVFRYSASLLKACAKGMAQAATTMIRVNERGAMSLHHMVYNPLIRAQSLASARGDGVDDTSTSNWIEFVISALENED